MLSVWHPCMHSLHAICHHAAWKILLPLTALWLLHTAFSESWPRKKKDGNKTLLLPIKPEWNLTILRFTIDRVSRLLLYRLNRSMTFSLSSQTVWKIPNLSTKQDMVTTCKVSVCQLKSKELTVRCECCVFQNCAEAAHHCCCKLRLTLVCWHSLKYNEQVLSLLACLSFLHIKSRL